MHFQLKSLVLWPHNEKLGPRIVSFEANKLNVITGASKTGKSAVIPIIDYCLGSERCAIPVKTIRDACSWFGIVIITSEGEKLLARREPGGQQSTGEMFLLEGKTVEIPLTVPRKNTSAEDVKRMLDKLAGLSNLGFDPSGLAGGFKGRPSFRDLLAFAFQPQNIVANPDVLFFKADTMEHKEKLRTIFPYVLGAVTPDVLARRWEVEQLLRELRRKERELEAQRTASTKWRAELQSWVSEARALGLLSPDAVPPDAKEHELLAALESIVTKTSADAQVSDTTLDTAAKENAELEREEGAVSLQLAEVKTRLENMTKLQAAVSDYTGALKKQRDRLQLSRWLRDLAQTAQGTCPVCGGAFDHANGELDALCDALANVEATARQLEPVPAAFDKELVQVRSQARRITDSLNGIRTRKRAIEERSIRIKEERLSRASVDRFLGRMEQALKVLKEPEGDPAFAAEIAVLKARLEELRAGLSDAAARTRQKAALERVSRTMARLLPGLDSERAKDPAELNIDDLTIRVTGSSGRPDFLWEIGSGANWLSYHVAAMIGLHDLFLSQVGSPVPSLLVLDQPSQVYFPRTLAKVAKEGDDPTLGDDEDVAAVRRVFITLAAATKENIGLQILVLDHASKQVWGDVDVHLVEEWRDGKALVPRAWLPSTAS
ncbi:DUF3732 domain-containing protein [Corallococcus sp. bb12-1]|uniref:DUF3732 domain-containing protein n=1 Tax=Corallococcus sp. bb12-1 TaxID=2996784 RepID=UPI00226DB3E1|nr:DUF3732 domain-containing protein [Corallococcus sp. bb12-1]MCY1045001.1 DUF3732 domain-containing protein [Corallococcus sp. bb12-1]